MSTFFGEELLQVEKIGLNLATPTNGQVFTYTVPDGQYWDIQLTLTFIGTGHSFTLKDSGWVIQDPTSTVYGTVYIQRLYVGNSFELTKGSYYLQGFIIIRKYKAP